MIFKLIISFLFMFSCYTKTKIDLNKFADKYEISGTWIRESGYTSVNNGHSNAFKVDNLLTFYEDGTCIYSCNESKSTGFFEVSGDTVTIIRSDELKSRYLYSLSGHDLKFIKLDTNYISSCIPQIEKDLIEGLWRYK